MSDLLIHYSFDIDSLNEEKTDFKNLATNIYDGEMANGAIYSGFKKIGSSSLELNAKKNQYLNILSPISTGLKGLTFSFWFCSMVSGDNSCIFSFGNGEKSDNIIVGIKNGNLSLSVFKGNQEDTELNVLNNINDYRWIQFVWTIDPNGTWKCYVDGNLFKTFSGKFYPNAIARNLCSIGKSNFNGTPEFNGNIDDFRLYNKILNNEEIIELVTPGYIGLINSGSSVWLPLDADLYSCICCDNSGLNMIVGVSNKSPSLRQSCLLYYYNGNYKSILTNQNDYVRKAWTDCSIGINFIDGNSIIYVVGTAGDNNEKFVVFISYDYGFSWYAYGKNNDNHYFYNCCSDNGQYMYVGNNNEVILKSNNYGSGDFKGGNSGKKSWNAIDCNNLGQFVIATASDNSLMYSTDYGSNYVNIGFLNSGSKSVCIDDIGYIAYAIDSTGLKQIILPSNSIQSLFTPYGQGADKANPNSYVNIESYNTVIVSSDGKYSCFCSCAGVIYIRDNNTGQLFQTNPRTADNNGVIISYIDLAGSYDLKIMYTISPTFTQNGTFAPLIYYTVNRGGFDNIV